MVNLRKALGLLIILACIWPPIPAVPQEEVPENFYGDVIPQALRRPQRGESPRYPRDVVIGELGQGTASGEAYLFAQNLMRGILSGNPESGLLAGVDRSLLEELFTELGPVEPRQYRLGGGREEPDGSTSFLFRFIGREQSISGELYLVLEEEAWRLEDIIAEEAQSVPQGGEAYKFDFSPYERFF
ncbi:MAG: hypothetical protein LBP93_03865 [Treponema sp.]|jgi:hypothetical protein|nr:hypothetical protein [Treponema sp.]